jgi:Glycosyltransferase family 87
MDISRVYGLRLLSNDPGRTRLAVTAAVGALLVYLVRAVQQLASLDVSNDYLVYLRAARGLVDGSDIYAGFSATFLQACPQAGAGCQGFSGHLGYIYPPLLAELMRPLAAMPTQDGARVWVVATHLALAISLLIAYRALRGLASVAALALLVTATLVFLPLYENLYFMQVNTFLLALLALAAWAFMTQASGIGAGIALGVASVLRVTPAGMAVALLRSRRALGGFVALVATVLALAAALAFLTPAMTEYVTHILPRLAGGTPWVENVSLSAALARAAALSAANPLVVRLLGVAPLLFTAAILLVTFVRSRSVDGPRGRAAVFAAFLAAIPIYASVTEQHHLVAELLVYALLAPSLIPGSRPWWLAVVAYPFLWISHDDPFNWALGLGGPVGDYALAVLMIVPLNLVGMFLLWLSCQETLRRGRSSPP